MRSVGAIATWNKLERRYGYRQLYFIPCSCYRRRPLLRSQRSRDVVLKALNDARGGYGFLIVGYIAMPEHIDLLRAEPNKGTPGTVMADVQAARRGGKLSRAGAKLGTMILAAATLVIALAADAGSARAQAAGVGAAFSRAYAMLSAQAQKEKAAGDPGGRALQNAASTLYAVNALVIQAPAHYGDPWADKDLTDSRTQSIQLCINLFNKQLIYVYRRDPKGAPVAMDAVRLITGENGVALLKDADFLAGTIPGEQVAYMRSSKIATGQLEKTIWLATKDGGLGGPIASAPPRRPNPNAAANAQKPEVRALPEFAAVYKLIQQLGPDTAGSFMAWTALASEDQENGPPGEKNDHIGTGTLVFWWRPTIDQVNSVFRKELGFALAQMQSGRAGSGEAWLKQLYGANDPEAAAKAVTALDAMGTVSDIGKNLPKARGNFHALEDRVSDFLMKVQYKAGAFYRTG